jgi:hypothetical protein
MKVKMLTSVGTADEGFGEGLIYDLAHDRAVEFMSLGWAERAEFHPDQPEACVKPECCRAIKKGARR